MLPLSYGVSGPLAAGTVIKGRFSSYELQEIMGKGGSGYVYRGVDCHTQMPVAVKVIITSTQTISSSSSLGSNPSHSAKSGKWSKNGEKENNVDVLNGEESENINSSSVQLPGLAEVEALLRLKTDPEYCPYIIQYLDHVSSTTTSRRRVTSFGTGRSTGSSGGKENGIERSHSDDEKLDESGKSVSRQGEEGKERRSSRGAVYTVTTTTFMIVEEFAARGSLQKQLRLLQTMSGGNNNNAVTGNRLLCLRERDASRILYDVTRALAYIHRRGILHRDIKAANVLLCEDGAVKLSDFGLAIMTIKPPSSSGTPVSCAPEEDSANRGAEISERGGEAAGMGGGGGSSSRGAGLRRRSSTSAPPSLPPGSLYWLAPEVLRGESPHTPAADVWSLGCLCVEMLTGKPPFYQFAPRHALYHIATLQKEQLPPLPVDWLPVVRGNATNMPGGDGGPLGDAPAGSSAAPLPRKSGAAVASGLWSKGARSGSSRLAPHPSVPGGPNVTSSSPVLSPECFDFLNACFQLNPCDRPSAETLQHHPWFMDARVQIKLNALLRRKHADVLAETHSQRSRVSNSDRPNHQGLEMDGNKNEELKGRPEADTEKSGAGAEGANPEAMLEDDIGFWVESHLFSQGRLHAEEWLWEGYVQKTLAVLPLMTPGESFRVIRSYAYAAQRCETEESAFMDHLGAWGFLDVDTLRNEDGTTAFPIPITSSNPEGPWDTADDLSRGLLSNSSSNQPPHISSRDEKPGKLCLAPVLLYWEQDLSILCTVEDLAVLFEACCVSMDPRAPFFFPSQPRLLWYLLHQNRQTAPEVSWQCLEALYRLLVSVDVNKKKNGKPYRHTRQRFSTGLVNSDHNASSLPGTKAGGLESELISEDHLRRIGKDPAGLYMGEEENDEEESGDGEDDDDHNEDPFYHVSPDMHSFTPPKDVHHSPSSPKPALSDRRRRHLCCLRMVQDGGILVLRSMLEEHCRLSFFYENNYHVSNINTGGVMHVNASNSAYYQPRSRRSRMAEEEDGTPRSNSSHSSSESTSATPQSTAGRPPHKRLSPRSSPHGSRYAHHKSAGGSGGGGVGLGVASGGISGGVAGTPPYRPWREVDMLFEMIQAVGADVKDSIPFIWGVKPQRSSSSLRRTKQREDPAAHFQSNVSGVHNLRTTTEGLLHVSRVGVSSSDEGETEHGDRRRGERTSPSSAGSSLYDEESVEEGAGLWDGDGAAGSDSERPHHGQGTRVLFHSYEDEDRVALSETDEGGADGTGTGGHRHHHQGRHRRDAGRQRGSQRANLLHRKGSHRQRRRRLGREERLAAPCIQSYCNTTYTAEAPWFFALQEASRHLCPHAIALLLEYLARVAGAKGLHQQKIMHIDPNLLESPSPSKTQHDSNHTTGRREDSVTTSRSKPRQSLSRASMWGSVGLPVEETSPDQTGRTPLQFPSPPTYFFSASPVTFVGTCLLIASSVSSPLTALEPNLPFFALQLLPWLQRKSGRAAAYLREEKGSFPLLTMVLKHYCRMPPPPAPPPLPANHYLASLLPGWNGAETSILSSEVWGSTAQGGSSSRRQSILTPFTSHLNGVASNPGLGAAGGTTTATTTTTQGLFTSPSPLPGGGGDMSAPGAGGVSGARPPHSSQCGGTARSYFQQKWQWSIQAEKVLNVFWVLLQQDARMACSAANYCPIFIDTLAHVVHAVREELRKIERIGPKGRKDDNSSSTAGVLEGEGLPTHVRRAGSDSHPLEGRGNPAQMEDRGGDGTHGAESAADYASYQLQLTQLSSLLLRMIKLLQKQVWKPVASTPGPGNSNNYGSLRGPLSYSAHVHPSNLHEVPRPASYFSTPNVILNSSVSLQASGVSGSVFQDCGTRLALLLQEMQE